MLFSPNEKLCSFPTTRKDRSAGDLCHFDERTLAEHVLLMSRYGRNRLWIEGPSFASIFFLALSGDKGIDVIVVARSSGRSQLKQS